jgi:hypothetical protein
MYRDPSDKTSWQPGERQRHHYSMLGSESLGDIELLLCPPYWEDEEEEYGIQLSYNE